MTIRARVSVALKPSDIAWLAIFCIVIGHNSVQAIRGGEQLSEAADRYKKCHPGITTGVIAVTALHLRRLLPPWADPWVWLFGAVGAVGKVQPFRHHMSVTVTSNTTRNVKNAQP